VENLWKVCLKHSARWRYSRGNFGLPAARALSLVFKTFSALAVLIRPDQRRVRAGSPCSRPSRDPNHGKSSHTECPLPSDELDPTLEATTKEFISVSELVSQAIVIEARGSIRFKTSIAIDRDWPARLPKRPLSEQITAHVAADHKVRVARNSGFPNEAAALGWYLQDYLCACTITVGILRPHAAAFLDRRTQHTVIEKILDAHLPESELELNKRAEIPGIDLKRAAGFIRYGHGHKVPVPRIVYWFQQEYRWDALVGEVRYGGIPPGYPMDEGPELGGHGPQIAAVLHHSIDSDLGLDLAGIANWMGTGRWPLDASPGDIITTISKHGEKPSSRFAAPLVELFWLFGRTPEMGAWRSSLRDCLHFVFQNLADDAIMRPLEFESESEIVDSAPAAGQFEAAGTPENHSAADPISERSLEPATPADPNARPLTVEEIAKTEGKDKVVQLYNLLKRLRGLPNVDKSEPALRTKFGDAFKPLWDAIDQSETLTAEDRKDFFRQNAKEFERYDFIAKILGSTHTAVRSLRFPRKPKAKKSRKTKRKKHA
jgi:hypothetical protein